jgi:hypothetical protein
VVTAKLEAVLGIEINAYAAELARVTIWIGEIQWMLNHGFHYRHDPVLPRPTEKQRLSISAAATRLVELRDMWLKQTGLASEEVARRTLTDLYNERPAWLDDAHATLDDEVLAAYGWPADLANREILARLLDLNLGREPA